MKLTIETTDASLIRTLGSILAGNSQVAAPSRNRTPMANIMADINKQAKANLAPTTLTELHQEQGRYLAYIRHLSQRNRRLVKAHRAGHGLDSAIRYAQSLAKAITVKPVKPIKLSRHRRKCDWCKRGFLAKQARSHFCTKRCRDAAYHQKRKGPDHSWGDTVLPTYVPPKARPKDKGTVLVPGDSLTAAHHES